MKTQKTVTPLIPIFNFQLQNRAKCVKISALFLKINLTLFLCPPDIFRRGFLLLHHTIFGQMMQLFCWKITGEHGIIFTSPVIVGLNGVLRHCIL